MGAGHRGIDSSGRLLRSEPHEPLAFCRLSKKATPRWIEASICFGSAFGAGLGLGPVSASDAALLTYDEPKRQNHETRVVHERRQRKANTVTLVFINDLHVIPFSSVSSGTMYPWSRGSFGNLSMKWNYVVKPATPDDHSSLGFSSRTSSPSASPSSTRPACRCVARA